LIPFPGISTAIGVEPGGSSRRQRLLHFGSDLALTSSIDSGITAVSDGRLYYHGHYALELAERGVRYEQVAELLLTGILPACPPVTAFHRPRALPWARMARPAWSGGRVDIYRSQMYVGQE
jgi:Citrate synthase, C-terminal domain